MSKIEQTRDVASLFVAAVEAGDHAAMDRLLAPDAEWWVLGRGFVDRGSFGKVHRSRRAAPVSVLRKVHTVTVEDDRAAIEIEVRLEWPDAVYHNQYHHLIRVAGGQIVSFREYADTQASTGFFAELPAAAVRHDTKRCDG